MKLPKHECGLYLEHNTYRNYYDSIEKAHEDEEYNDLTLWQNKEAKQKSLETKKLWTLQWYPNTPIGFHRIAAPTLEDLLKFANEVEE